MNMIKTKESESILNMNFKIGPFAEGDYIEFGPVIEGDISAKLTYTYKQMKQALNLVELIEKRIREIESLEDKDTLYAGHDTIIKSKSIYLSLLEESKK